MQAALFSDTFYHGENHIEFDPQEVVSAEERTERLFLRGEHIVTQITLQNGAQYVLKGALKAQIEHARHTAHPNTAHTK